MNIMAALSEMHIPGPYLIGKALLIAWVPVVRRVAVRSDLLRM